MKHSVSFFTRRQITFIIIFFMLGTTFFTLSLVRATNVPPVTETVYLETETSQENPNCRYGASVGGPDQNPFIESIGLGWVITFNVNLNRTLPPGVEYVPMIRMKQDKVGAVRLDSYTITTQPLTDDPGGLGPLVAAHPGLTWIVGNEVDRFFWQDDVEPHVYAQAYHDVYHFIKERDPSARIAVAGLVEVTPNRLEYLDLVWDRYLDQFGVPMPVDIWTMHIYVLPEAKVDNEGIISGSNASIAVGTSCWNDTNMNNCNIMKWESNGTSAGCPQNNVYCTAEHDDISIFINQAVSMRQWMKYHSQQDKPLLLTEFSLLYPYVDEGGSCFLQDEYQQCFTPNRVNTFMEQTFEYLETAVDPYLGYPLDNNRLVQQWLWFAMAIEGDETTGSASRLVHLDGSGNPTTLTDVGLKFQDEVESRPQSVNFFLQNAHTTAVVSGTTSAEISVDIMNNGNVANDNDYTVTFFRDEALTDVIDSVTILDPVGGCAMHESSASAMWNDLNPGLNKYWVRIGSSQDSDPSDNVTSGFVLVGGYTSYLSSIHRYP